MGLSDLESGSLCFFTLQKEHISCSHMEEGIEGDGPTSSNLSIKAVCHFCDTNLLLLSHLIQEFLEGVCGYIFIFLGHSRWPTSK